MKQREHWVVINSHESLLHTTAVLNAPPELSHSEPMKEWLLTPAHFAGEDNRGSERKRNLHRVTQPRRTRVRVTNKSSVVNSILLATMLYCP